MPALTFAQLTAPALVDSAADPVVALAAARLAKKAGLYASLNAIGVVGTVSWTTGSVPSSLIEVYAWSLTDYDLQQAYVALGASNQTATGTALTAWAEQVYGNSRAAGSYTLARVLLTDVAGAGPFTFQASSVSFSVGRGGLLFDGFDFLGTGLPVVLPRLGSVYVYVRSAASGSAYSQLSVSAVNFFARGALPGVSVTNDATWLSFNGAVVGTDDETDATLRARNADKWGKLGTGSPAKAYRNAAMAVAPNVVTRVSVLSNLDILDPGRVDVLLAGPAGAVDPSVTSAVQNALAPTQVGGSFIPETARCVVSSAANLTVNVSATVSVEKTYNTAAFQAQVSADYAAYAASIDIGGGPLGLVSADRLEEVLQLRAGLSPGVIYDVVNFLPAADVPVAYNQTPIFSLNFTWVSV